MSRHMPAQRPGQSEQTVCTPVELLTAVKKRLGITEFVCDLAATYDNSVADACYTEDDNGLIQSWVFPGEWSWCNPPYASLRDWTLRADEEARRGGLIAMLLPASVGSNWWKSFVHNHCHVLFLNGRVTFVGHSSPYPKDLAVLLYTPYVTTGYDVWTWTT